MRPVAVAEIQARRASRAYALMLDAARPFSATPLGALLGLATADDPQTAVDLAKHPPRLVETNVRTLTRTMRLGVLGEVRVQGARAADLTLGATFAGGMDLGNASRTRKTP